ncbi:hypothetical protein [Kushneria konosiri]|uniref:Pentapeptide MXKDX repeat protein n=1 Tax=Kushneria konosiri TaxID=698828 RepID=A0A2Z2H3M2_9GAMM|nr:hypothetical protein [Kushneria konosiri]ARS51728.1 hypothetical protein B9G99_01495 [Kushneria konosiri]
MKKLIATVFCAAFVLPAMSAMASSEATHDSADVTHTGQTNSGSAQMEDMQGMSDSNQGSMDNANVENADVTHTGQTKSGSAQMSDMKGMDDSTHGSMDSTSVENADETMTGRQGHSAQMESTEPMQDGDKTEHGASPSSN